MKKVLLLTVCSELLFLQSALGMQMEALRQNAINQAAFFSIDQKTAIEMYTSANVKQRFFMEQMFYNQIRQNNGDFSVHQNEEERSWYKRIWDGTKKVAGAIASDGKAAWDCISGTQSHIAKQVYTAYYNLLSNEVNKRSLGSSILNHLDTQYSGQYLTQVKDYAKMIMGIADGLSQAQNASPQNHPPVAEVHLQNQTENDSPSAAQERPVYSEGETQTDPSEERSHSDFAMIPMSQINLFAEGLRGNAPQQFCENLQGDTRVCVQLRDMASLIQGVIQTTIQTTLNEIANHPQARLMLTNRQSEEILEEQNITERPLNEFVTLMSGDKVFTQGEKIWFGEKCTFKLTYNSQECSVTVHFSDDGFIDPSQGIILATESGNSKTYTYPMNENSFVLLRKPGNFVDFTKIERFDIKGDDFKCWTDKEMLHFGTRVFKQGQVTEDRFNGNGFFLCKKSNSCEIRAGTFADGILRDGVRFPFLANGRYLAGVFKPNGEDLLNGKEREVSGTIKNIENGSDSSFSGQFTDPFGVKYNVNNGVATEFTEGASSPKIEEIEDSSDN